MPHTPHNCTLPRLVCLSVSILLAIFLFPSPSQAGLILQKPVYAGLNSGLVGYWSFDGPDMAGVTAYDRSGQGNNCTIANVTRTAGRIGQGLEWSGTSSDCNINESAHAFTPNNWSVSAWVKLDTYPAPSVSRYILNNGDDLGSTASGFELFVSGTDNKMNINVVVGTDSEEVASTTTIFPLNTWAHVVAVKNGTSLRLYIDTALQQDRTLSSATMDYTADTPSTRIGERTDQADGTQWDGIIDEVRVYNRALSADEIKRLYKIGATFKIGKASNTGTLKDGLVGWWSFDGPDMAENASGVMTAYDRSGQNNHASTTGAASTFPRKTIGRIGQALEFDNTDDYATSIDSASLDITGALTISAWIKKKSFASSGNYDTIVAKQFSDSTRISYSSGTRSDKLNFFYCTGASSACAASQQEIETSSTLATDRWYHVAMVYNDSANSISFYFDGVVQSKTVIQGTPETSSLVTSNDPLQLGGGYSSEPIDGVLDEVRIYNRVLSADEIKRLYKIGATLKVNVAVAGGSLNDGLVGYWPFGLKDLAQNASGVLTAYDRSGQGNNGTSSGANVPKRAAGKIGQALEFTSTTSARLFCGDNVCGGTTGGGLDMGTRNWSVSAWVKSSSLTSGGSRNIISKEGVGASKWILGSGFSPQGTLMAVIRDDVCSSVISQGGPRIDDQQWHHIVATWDRNNSVIQYVDGVEVGSSNITTCSGSVDNDGSLGIGQTDGPQGDAFPGVIDEVRIYNRVLSADEIKRLYRGN